MSSRLPLVIDDRWLNPVELRAAALDGQLGAIGSGYAVTDLPSTPASRAASLAAGAPDRTIVSDRTAAWVWGWTAAAGPLRVCVSMSSRIASPIRRAHRAREVLIETDEIRRLEGVAVTSPARTLLDLARFDEGDDVVELLAAGISATGLGAEGLAAVVERRPASANLRRARARLAAALELVDAAQPLLTR